MSNSLFTKRTSSLTCGLQVRQCPRRIIRITSNPFIVALQFGSHAGEPGFGHGVKKALRLLEREM
jgi:hypothetical protein